MIRRSSAAARGFTLIELMIVVALIGVLASIAIPVFERLTLKAKAAERAELIVRIKKAVDDLYLQESRVELVTSFQPALPAATIRRSPSWSGDWSRLFKSGEEVLGSLYYSYRVDAWEQDGDVPAGFTIETVGDVDGDGVPSVVTVEYARNGGSYQQVSPTYAQLAAQLNEFPY